MNFSKVPLLGIISVLLIILVFSCDLIFPDEDSISIPRNVYATQGISNGYVTISWTENSAQTYYVYRSISQSGSPTKISSSITASRYIDSTVVSGDHYWYSVSGADMYGNNETARSSTIEGWSSFLEAPTIVADPVSTEYSASSVVSVTIEIPSGANVYYTIDGSDPKTSSTKVLAVANVSLSVSKTTTIKAFCIMSGMESETTTKELNFEIISNTLVIDVPSGYFTSLSSDSLSVSLNGEVIGTIYPNQLSSSSAYTQFSFSYAENITDATISSGSFTDVFNGLNDFVSDVPEAVTQVSDIKKIVLFAKSDLDWNIVGTGVDISPKDPWLSIGTPSSNAITITASEYEDPTNLGFNIYTSTDGVNFTKYNTALIDASAMYAGYTLTGLTANTLYTINAETVYADLVSVRSSDRTFTTDIQATDDSSLSNLELSDGIISFNSSTTTYSVDVSNNISTFSVTPTVNESNATVTVNNVSVTSGTSSGSVAISEGATVFTIVVTAADFSISTYELTVNRASGLDVNSITPSSSWIDGNLVAGEVVWYSFIATAGTTYTVAWNDRYSADYTKTADIMVGAFEDMEESSLYFSLDDFGYDAPSLLSVVSTCTVYIKVVGYNSTEFGTFAVKVEEITSLSNDSSLSNLELSDGIISFNSSTTTYSVDVSNNISTFSVTPTVNESNATVTVNNVSVTSETSSNSVSLNEGANPFTIVVTAADNTTTTYTLTVNKAAANVNLSYTVAQVGGASSTVSTNELLLTFNVDPTTLSADNITLTGATKGSLTGSGTTRTINISNITVADGELVSVDISSPSGYSVTTSTQTVVVYKGPLAVGDAYQGGIIAYFLVYGDSGYDANVQHGLIAATTDNVGGINWITGGSTQTTENTGTLLNTGTGQANTTAMMDQAEYTGGAAKICDDYIVGVYNDWYLPSKYELNKLYINREDIGGFTTTYWSSSEFNATTAWAHSFVTGNPFNGNKNYTLLVRPIRSF